MKYPISYVFITQDDHLEAFMNHQTLLPPGSFPTQTVQPALKTSHLFSSLLTPPMSPNDDHNMKDRNIKSTNSLHVNKNESVSRITKSSCISSIKRSVSQECCSMVSSDKSDDTSTLWDFQDPSAVFKCVCSR